MSAYPLLSVEAAADLVTAHLPGALRGPLELVGEGDFCFAYRAGEHIVRVAKHGEAAAAIRLESCVLHRIANGLPLDVPRPTYHAPEGAPPFTVHRALRGAVLTRAAWETLSGDHGRRLAEQLATFLRRLHGRVDDGTACGAPVLDEAAFAGRLRDAARVALASWLPEPALERLDRFLSTRAAEPARRPLALLHRDVAPGHLLYDELSGALTGVIDFGDVAVGPPARDFIFLYEDFGVDLCEPVVAAYAEDDAAALMEEVRAWYLLEALSWTLERLRAGALDDAAHGLREIARELDA